MGIKKKISLLVICIIFTVISVNAVDMTGRVIRDITGNLAYGTFQAGLCIVAPTNFSSSCPSIFYDNGTIDCEVTSYGHSVNNYSSYFTTNNTLFNITNDGLIYKPDFNITDIGNHSAIITANYTDECGNKSTVIPYDFEVLRVTNHAPVCRRVKDQNITQGDTIRIRMSSYCEDQDFDPLSYEGFANIEQLGFTITIQEDELVLTTTDWFYGEILVYFTATDTKNASDSTNLIKILVDAASTPTNSPSSGDSSSSSSSSSSASDKRTVIVCNPKWKCTEWGACSIGGYQERSCVDLNNCNMTATKPNTTQSCIYVPTCFDGVKNGNEMDVDCGGSCTKQCIDPQTCFDGIKNGDELDIDCGGSCTKQCPNIEQPLILSSPRYVFIILVISSLTLIGYYLIRKIPKKLKVKKLMRIEGSKKSGIELMAMLDELESNILKTKVEITLSKLANVIEQYLMIILQTEEIDTYEELIKRMTSSNIKIGLKEVILSIYKDISEIEFSQKQTTRTEALLLIHESKNIVSTIISPKEYIPKEITIVKETNDTDSLFKVLIDANYNLLRNKMWDKNKIKIFRDTLLSRNVKNKFLINSFNRFLKLEWNKYAKNK